MNAEFCSCALKSILSWQGDNEKQGLSTTQQLNIGMPQTIQYIFTAQGRLLPYSNRGLMDIKCEDSLSTNWLEVASCNPLSYCLHPIGN